MWKTRNRFGTATGRLDASRRPLPDFLILGAQRAGTTSLHRLLAQHPGVLGARFGKGVHYFDEAYDRPVSWYQAHFPTSRARRSAAASAGDPVVAGESSPYYLFHPYVPYWIARTLPDVRCIALLRDPVARAWSHYQHNVARGFEALSFADALAAEPARLAGAEATLATPGAIHLGHRRGSYVARGRYTEQLARYHHALGPDRTLVVLTGDLDREPSAVLERCQAFLGLAPQPVDRGERRNQQPPTDLPEGTEQTLRSALAEPDRELAELLGRELSW